MRELTNKAKADIRKLYNGVPWVELLEIQLPEYFIPTEQEKKFLALSPEGRYYALLTNVINEGKIALPATGWQTQGQLADYKWFFCVPYERDNVEDTNEQQGQMNSRLTLGDTGGVIKTIVDRTDGLYGCEVKVGFAMQNNDSLLDEIEVYESEVTLDFTINATQHDRTNFACILSSDTPLEWKFPARTMFKNVCHFQFKGLECGFSGNIIQKVLSGRKSGGVTEIFNKFWAINGGYIQGLDPNGLNVTVSWPATAADYEYISSQADDYYFVIRDNNSNIHYGYGAIYSYFKDTNAVRIKHKDYPYERTLSSGGYRNAYAITCSSSLRYLYRFNNATATRIGGWQYFNIVSSPEANLCFTIQGGYYVEANFVQADQPAGRLIKVTGTSTVITDLYQGKYWKWVRAITANVLYALDEDNYLWYFKDVSGTLTPFQVCFVNDETNYLQLTEIPTSKTFSVFEAGGACFIIDDGKLYSLEEDAVYGTNEDVEWFVVKALDGWSAAVFNSSGIGIAEVKGKAVHDVDYLPIAGNVKSFLGVAGYNFLSPKIYYVSGNEIYLYEKKDFKACNHTLTDCKERGNEVRFGGFPGVGSGGLTK